MNRLLYGLMAVVLGSLAKLMYRHKVVCLGVIPKGAAIVVANHVSFFDPPLVGLSFKEPLIFIAYRGLFDAWPLSWGLPRLGVLPVSGDRQDLASLKTACQHLKNGQKVVIFPEGGRSSTSEISPIKAGMALLARKGQCPIIPVWINGSFDIWPRSRLFPKLWGRTSCIIGHPIPWEDFSHLDKKTAQEAIAERVLQELQNLRNL